MKDPFLRRSETLARLKAQGIAVNEHLPMVENSDMVKLKSFEEITAKAAATLLVIQLACDIGNGEYEASMEIIPKVLNERFGVGEYLNAKERRLLDGTYEMQDAVDVAWEYETYWSLVWALGLIDDEELTDVSGICDCDKAIHLLIDCKGLNEFRARCKLRDIEDVLDMLDYFYCLHWAVVEKRLKPSTPIGGTNAEAVPDRRRGLEWLVSAENDWIEISLDT